MAKIQELKSGQKTVTLPKALCLAMGLKKGDKVGFRINKQGNLEMVKE